MCYCRLWEVTDGHVVRGLRTSWLFKFWILAFAVCIFGRFWMTMMSVFTYFGVFLPVALLKRPPEYEKCNRAEYQELFATILKKSSLFGDKSFLPYYHRILFIVAVQSITQLRGDDNVGKRNLLD